MSIHTIRLAGPWELHEAGSKPTRVQLPFEWPSHNDPCQLVRKFHRPSGLTDECQVHIVVTSSDTPLIVFINEEPVDRSAVSMDGQSCESTYDATALLKPFNSLNVQPPNGTSPTVESAWIEIHAQE